MKILAEEHGKEKVIMASHPRARTAVRHIFHEDLDQYMQWFPWSWFSDMLFVGAGGFSAVYSCEMKPAYEVLTSTRMALKIVDDKLLNEVSPHLHSHWLCFLTFTWSRYLLNPRCLLLSYSMD